MCGWLATVAKERTARCQVPAYRELASLFDFFAGFTIAPFEDAIADRFDDLRTSKLRLGTMDLKIAATALVNGALLLSANRRDFECVAGLQVENGSNKSATEDGCVRRSRSVGRRAALPAFSGPLRRAGHFR
jgi:tRNA(fMet)-specific endonuclease VapC